MVCSAAILEGFILVPSSIVDEKRRKKIKRIGCWAIEWLDQIFVKKIIDKVSGSRWKGPGYARRRQGIHCVWQRVNCKTRCRVSQFLVKDAMSTNKVLKLKRKFGEISDEEMVTLVRERSSNNKGLPSGVQLPRMDRAGATQV